MSLFTAGKAGFSMIPEGTDVLLQVTGVDFDPDFFTDTVANVEVTFKSEKGDVHTERYNTRHEVGNNIFTNVVQKVNQVSIGEGESMDKLVGSMVGKHILVDIEHVTSDKVNDKTGKPYVNVRFKNVRATDLVIAAAEEYFAADTVIDTEDDGTDEFEF